MADVDHKLCAKCKETKLRNEFGPASHRKDGLRPYCRPCHNEVNRLSRVKNPGQGNAARKAWEEANPEKLREKCARWRKKHPERVVKLRKDFYDRHQDRLRKKNNERRKIPSNRIHHTISSRLRSLVNNKAGKSTRELLGYTFEELKVHLERQFTQGMSWDNYGSWHIDHIVPLSSFKISDIHDPDIRRAWGLPNLRPLWAPENIRKHAKRIHLI